MFRIDLPQPFMRKGRAGAVAQQPLQALPVAPSIRALVSRVKPPPCPQRYIASPSANGTNDADARIAFALRVRPGFSQVVYGGLQFAAVEVISQAFGE